MPEQTVRDIMSSKSTFGGTPSFRTNFHFYDSSGTGSDFHNEIQQIEEHRRLRYTQFPSLRGIYDWSREHSENKTKTVRWKEEVTPAVEAPHRAYDNLIDPISGFASTVDDVDRNTGHVRAESLVQLNRTPQSVIPSAETTQHKKLVSASNLTRLSTWSPGAPTAWNSRKTPDIWIRSRLGGWTSDVDPRKVQDAGARPQSSQVNGQTQSVQDQLALRYIYNSSTQRGYEDVPWDTMLRPKQWPSTLTVYAKPDLALYQRNAKHFSPSEQVMQRTNAHTPGMLSRYQHCQDGPVTCASLEYQLKQSPLYSEHVNQTDREVARFGTPDANNVRRFSTGQQRDKEQSDALGKPYCDHRRKSRMSKMVTLVPPHNPFNIVETPPLYG